MIITKDFVMLNLPKTGSTFARKVVRRAYKNQASPIDRLLRKLYLVPDPVQEVLLYSTQFKVMHQHGKRRDIPQQHRDKPLLTITRNPVDRYLSQYKFGWWKTNLSVPYDDIVKSFQNFPNLSFSEFYYLMNDMVLPRKLAEAGLKDINIGYQTWQFFDFYLSDPLYSAKNYFEKQGDFDLKSIENIIFIRQENLSGDLMDFLIGKVGFHENAVKFINTYKKINVSEDLGDSPISKELLQEMKKREGFLFELFPDYN